ncbi:MAG: hypothetical protein AAF585_06620 [Verrucomicrobiota bacterium]
MKALLLVSLAALMLVGCVTNNAGDDERTEHERNADAHQGTPTGEEQLRALHRQMEAAARGGYY